MWHEYVNSWQQTFYGGDLSSSLVFMSGQSFTLNLKNGNISQSVLLFEQFIIIANSYEWAGLSIKTAEKE